MGTIVPEPGIAAKGAPVSSAQDRVVPRRDRVAAAAEQPAPHRQPVELLHVGADVDDAHGARLEVERTFDEGLVGPAEVALEHEAEALHRACIGASYRSHR